MRRRERARVTQVFLPAAMARKMYAQPDDSRLTLVSQSDGRHRGARKLSKYDHPDNERERPRNEDPPPSFQRPQLERYSPFEDALRDKGGRKVTPVSGKNAIRTREGRGFVPPGAA